MLINLLLADDHDLVRTGMRRLLEDVEGITIIAEATTGEEAVVLCRDNKPQVVLMDVNMPGMGGLEATRKIVQRDNNIKVIIVTMNEDEVLAQSLLKAGAAGYLTKASNVHEIVHAIREVIANRHYITPQMATQLALADIRPQEDRSPFKELSERELQVMMKFLDGKKINEISDELSLSPKTVSTYRYRLFNKLNIQSDVELARLAIRHGMLSSTVC